MKNFIQFLKEGKYSDILSEFEEELGKFKDKTNNSDDDYFEHIPSPDIAEDLLEEYYKPGFKLLDIGCGVGNIMKLSQEIGYDVYGLEINKDLSRFHKNLNVKYGDALSMDLSFIKDMDIIYMYRPINDLKKAEILINKIYDNCKESCIIIYLTPHEIPLETFRKFFVLRDNQRKNKKLFMGDEHWTTFTVLTPNKKIKNINVEETINRALNLISKYKTNSSKLSGSFIDTYKCKTQKEMGEFTDRFRKFMGILLENNLNMNVHYCITYDQKEQKGSGLENIYYIMDKFENNIKIPKIKDIELMIRYSIYGNKYYRFISPYGFVLPYIKKDTEK